LGKSYMMNGTMRQPKDSTRLGIIFFVVLGTAMAQDVKLRGGNVLACETYSFRDQIQAGKLDVFAVPELYRGKGIKGISFNERYFTGRDDAYIDRLKAAVKKAGRVIVALQADGDLTLADETKRKQQIEHYQESLRIARRLGTGVMRINAGGSSRDSKAALAAGTERLIASLKEMLPLARQLKVKIAIENHGGVSTDADNLVKVFEATDPKWVGVLLDFGNFHSAQRYDEITKLAPHTFGTHVKVGPLDENGDPKDYDLPRVFKVLRESKYRGSLSIEYVGKVEATLGVDHARDLIRKHW